MPAKLLLLSMFGWAAGIIPAIIDGIISVNRVMHNTQWVPGHFHFYLLLGVLPMVLALMFHVIGQRTPARASDKLIFRSMSSAAWYSSSRSSRPATSARRGASRCTCRNGCRMTRPEPIGAALVIAAMLVFSVQIVVGLLRSPGNADPARAAG